MKNTLKKYWFVSTIIVLVVAFLLLFVYNENKDKLAGKQVDGKDVVAVFNGQNIFADEVYNHSLETNGTRILTMLMIKELVNQEYPSNDEFKEAMEAQKKALIANYQQRNANGYETEIGNALKQIGFANGFQDLDTYIYTNLKQQKVVERYIINNPSYLQEIDDKKGRIVSHILVKFPDLTEAEKSGKSAEEIATLQKAKNEAEKENLDKKMAEIDEQLKTTDFATVAEKYTDDTGSKAAKGSVGYVTTETSFVPEFLNTALALNEGEVSDWVQTTYGYHKIKVDTTGKDNLLANDTVKAQIINNILQKDTTIYPKTLKELIEKYPVQSEDATVKKVLEALTKE